MNRLRELWERIARWYEARSAREQRLLIAGGIVAGLLLGYVFVVEPLMNLRADLATEIAEKHAQLEGEARLVTRAAALRAERDSLRQRLKVEKEKLLPGESTTLAQAALQERLNTLAKEKNVSVQSVQVLKDDPLDPFVRVAIRMTLSGEIRPLAEMLAGLEFGKTQIVVPYIEVSRRGAVPGSKGPRPLSATVEASGFFLTRAAPEAPAEGEGAAGEGGAAGGADGGPSAEAEGAPGAEAPSGNGAGGLEIVPGVDAGENGGEASEAERPAPAEGAPPPGEKPAPPAEVPPTEVAPPPVPPATAVPSTVPADVAPPSPTAPDTAPPGTPPPATPPPGAPPKPEDGVDGTAPPPVPPTPPPPPEPS